MSVYKETFSRSEQGFNCVIYLAHKHFQTETVHVFENGSELVKIIPDSIQPAKPVHGQEQFATDACKCLDTRVQDLSDRGRLLIKIRHAYGHLMTAHGGFVGSSDGWESVDEFETSIAKYR